MRPTTSLTDRMAPFMERLDDTIDDGDLDTEISVTVPAGAILVALITLMRGIDTVADEAPPEMIEQMLSVAVAMFDAIEKAFPEAANDPA